MTIRVFTCGCFDLLHGGHVRLLQWARRCGDELVVGLNSDESVRHIKGPQRPIVGQEERREILLALECVDSVEVFDGRDACPLITKLRPDILVKGPECRRHPFPEAAAIEEVGGRLLMPEWLTDESTSGTIATILARYGAG